MTRKRTVKTRTAQPVPGNEKQLVGRRELTPLQAWLDHLHKLPRHGNRNLLADHVLVAHLVTFLSPALKSLRRIESFFDHRLARQRFCLPRVPKSTLSDAQAMFNPALLDPIIADLRQRVPDTPHDARLDKLLKTLTAVDGSFFQLAPRVWWALYRKPNGTPRQPRKQNQHGNVRVDVHFNVLTGLPEQAILSNGRTPEYETLRAHLEPNRFYVLDRAYHAYEVLGAIIAARSDFHVRDQRPLTAEDRLAGVQHDWVVTPTYRRLRFRQPVRLIEITVPGQPQPVRLLSNRVDLPAAVIGLLYRHRWQIELFFRWLKCVVKQQHFMSESADGMALQLYAALIGTLLIALEIGTRPNKYDYAMLSLVASGLLDYDEAREQMEKRRAERARASAWQKAYNARRKLKH